jgi:cell division protein FtsL
MYRYFIGGLVVAIIAVVLGYLWFTQQQMLRARGNEQIAELNQQLSKLQSENAELKSALAKVEAEENRLANENDMLTKTLENARLTGKVPSELPYPPK